jgi:hypothetical protein
MRLKRNQPTFKCPKCGKEDNLIRSRGYCYCIAVKSKEIEIDSEGRKVVVERMASNPTTLRRLYRNEIKKFNTSAKLPAASPSRKDKQLFYQSREWQSLRYDVLRASGAICSLCGASPNNKPGVVIHVDHIKPISKYWHLRKDRDNLQVLCGECNQGKSDKVT